MSARDVDSGHNGSSLFSVNADNKELFRKTVGETDVAEAVILDVEGRQWIAFESGQTTGNMHLCVGNIVAYPKGVVPEGVRAGKNRRGGGRLAGLPDMCRLVSAVPPISLKGNMARKEALFDGSDEKRTLDMGGYSFTEGFILSNDNGGGAAADFDVDNQFDFVTFTTGWIDQCHVLKTDTLQVFADDSLVYSTPLLASRGNVPHKVDIDRCHRLSFRKKGIDADRQPVFAVADVVAYRGEVIDNTLFAHPKPELPPETDIYAIGKPFLYYVNDSMPMVDNGFALQSHISESGERMPSCAAFNTYGAYSTLTFTVACAKKGNTDERIVLEEFSIGADHNQASSIILYENMEPTTYSVNIANCSQLLFWLDCGAQPSSQYVFYNIGLSNDPVAPHRSPFE